MTTIDIILDANRNKKSPVLNLDFSNKDKEFEIFFFPEEIKEFDWIKTIILKNVNFKSFINMPNNLGNLIIEDCSMPNDFDYMLPNKLQTLQVTNSFLISMDNIPLSITNLNVSKNTYIEELDLEEYVNLKKLVANDCSIKNIRNFPPNLVHFELKNNMIKKNSYVDFFPSTLEYINLENTNDKKIPDYGQFSNELMFDLMDRCDVLHTLNLSGNVVLTELYIDKNAACFNSLKELDISHSSVEKMELFPANLTKFYARYSSLESIEDNLPESLIVLDVYGALITDVNCYRLPPKLEILNVGYNELEYFNPDILHPNIKQFNIEKNKINTLNINELISKIGMFRKKMKGKSFHNFIHGGQKTSAKKSNHTNNYNSWNHMMYGVNNDDGLWSNYITNTNRRNYYEINHKKTVVV